MTKESLSHASRREWAVALILLGAATVAALVVSFGAGPLDLSSDQVTILTFLKRILDGELFSRDLALAERGTARFYPPLFGKVLLRTHRLTGDWVSVLRVWIVPLTFAYLVAMYTFLRSVIPSGSAAILTTLLSLPVTRTLGATYWGCGPVSQVLPRTFVLPLVPLSLWLYGRWEDRWRLPLLFAIVGLAANMHPPTALGLGGALGLMAALHSGLQWRRWVRVGCCALALLAGAAPYIVRFLSATARTTAGVRGPAMNAIAAACVPTQLLTATPITFGRLGGWVLAAAVAALALRVAQRALDRRDRLLGCFALGVLVMSVGVAGGAEALGKLTGRPYAVNLLRNFKLIVLVYYAYIALLLAQMLRWVRQGGRGRLVGMAVIAALALEGACRAGGALELRAVPAAAARGWRKSVTELCAHVKQNTPKDALFHICDPGTKDMPLLFRFLAERSVTVSRKDIWCFWYSRQGRLLEWHQRVHRTAAECARRDTPQAVITAREYGADYLVVPADWDAADLPVAYDEPGGYRVYALRGAGGAHRGAATPAEPRRQPYGIADCQLPIAD